MELETGQNWDYEHKRSLKLTFSQIFLYLQIGPNVSIGQNVQVAAGARIKNPLFRTMDSLI